MLTGLVILHLHNNAFTGTIPEIGDIPGLCKGFFVIMCDAQVLFSPSSACFSKPNNRRAHLYFVPGSLFESIMAVVFTLHVNNILGEMPNGVCDLRDTNGGILKIIIADCAPLENPKMLLSRARQSFQLLITFCRSNRIDGTGRNIGMTRVL